MNYLTKIEKQIMDAQNQTNRLRLAIARITSNKNIFPTSPIQQEIEQLKLDTMASIARRTA